MSSKIRFRLAALGGAVALAVVTVFVVLPVFGTSHPDADRLRLTPNTEAFYYGAIDPTSPDVTVQPITVGNKGCEIGPLTGPLVTLSSDGVRRVKDPGLVDHGIGVKSGGSNGTPCSLTDESEKLIIASKNSWSKLELDVEAKGDAWVHAELRSGGPTGTLVETYQLLTGTSIADYNAANDPDELPVDDTAPYVAVADSSDRIEACANPSDSGPDNIYFDNCRWIITSDYRFDTVILYTTVGSVALMGGSDFETFDPTGFAAGMYDSLFYRAPAPTALGDPYSTDEDTPLNVAAPGVLSNDDDPFGGTLTAALVTSTSNGDLILNSNGSFTYDPDADWNGTDTFTYQASAGAEPSAIATVTITVNAVNDPPEAIGTPLPATEDTSATYPVDKLAFDPEEDTLTVTAASADNPGAVVTFDDGNVYYTPAPDSCESDTLNFTVSDGTDSVMGSVTINVTCVNDAPVAGDDVYETNERNSGGTLKLIVAAPGVLDGDNDADDDTLTVSGAPAPSEGGTVTNLSPLGSFDYTPSGSYSWAPGEFFYTETWDYTVSDGTLTDTGTVTITVFRVVCSGETVSDEDGDIKGSFTLLTVLPDCKRYEVDADAEPGAETITFTPGGGDEAFFRGELTFVPQILDINGTFFLGLEYDPDNEGPEGFRTLQVCEDPVFDDGLVTSATIPEFETWCFAGALSRASATVDGEIVTVFQVYGKEDPRFGFK